MWDDERMFFDRMPRMLALYEALRTAVDERCPGVEARVGKTQISLYCRHMFAAVSLPWRRVKGWPEEYLLLTFGLSYRKDSSRIAVATEPYPGRWTHHVLLTDPSQLDEELLGWVEEAYTFALTK